jgi:acylglycerol lipase
MTESEPFVTNLELRESTPDGELGAGLSHTSKGLVLLHVLELAAYGEPRGAVTCVHDAGDHGGRYLALARTLARDGWAIALPDLRGHGKSEGERGHSNGIKEIVRDLGDVQDHLAYRQPEAPKVLVGQGLGAVWALAYASERQGGVAALVLAAPLFAPRFELPERSGGLMKLFKKVGPSSPGKLGWQAAQLSSDAAEQRARSADPLVHDVITLRAGEQALEAATRYRARMSELPMPVLCLGGSKDALASAAELRALAGPRCDVQIFDGLLHDLFHEARAPEVIDFVAAWLNRKLPRGT